MSRSDIFAEIDEERTKQDEEYGGPERDDDHGPGGWILALTKHVGRAVQWKSNVNGFRRQMLIVASLGVAAIEWCDRRWESENPDVE
jgi:hypothetical protein